jgi:cell division protein FtsB
MLKKFMQFIAIILGVGLIVNLTRDIWQLVKAKDQIRVAEQRVVQLEEENRILKEKQKYYASQEFVEEEARNKLNMAKPGETIVVLPKTAQGSGNNGGQNLHPDLPNWQKWVRLFF